MTTTLAEKLLAKAQELEDAALHLRKAAEVMNGHALNGKQRAIHTTMAAAIKVRRQQRPRTEPTPAEALTSVADTPPEIANPANYANKTAYRQGLVIHYLDTHGAQPLRAIAAHLRGHGVGVTPSRISQIMIASPLITRRGRGHTSRWALKKQTPASRRRARTSSAT